MKAKICCTEFTLMHTYLSHKGLIAMFFINTVCRDAGPRNRIAEVLPEVSEDIEMYENDSAFVCGLLERFKPRKILEVGVADGGTTAVVLQCMKELQAPFSLYSVDVLEKNSRKPQHEIGYLGIKAKELLGIDNCQLYRGMYLPQVIQQIGDGIDFAIIDTAHVLPGELLDFLVLFPFLAPNAVVCLHDIRQNHKNPPSAENIATNVLFNCVAAEKYIDADETRKPDYPNIGAFQINEDTPVYINNAFGALTQSWSFVPSEEVMAYYDAIIKRYYAEESLWLYERAVSMNRQSYEADRVNRVARRAIGKLTRTLTRITASLRERR